MTIEIAYTSALQILRHSIRAHALAFVSLRTMAGRVDCFVLHEIVITCKKRSVCQEGERFLPLPPPIETFRPQRRFRDY